MSYVLNAFVRKNRFLILSLSRKAIVCVSVCGFSERNRKNIVLNNEKKKLKYFFHEIEHLAGVS